MKFGKIGADIKQQSTNAPVTAPGMSTLNEQKQLGNGPGRRMTTISVVGMTQLNEQKLLRNGAGAGRRMTTIN
jgi:hypothetical protein